MSPKEHDVRPLVDERSFELADYFLKDAPCDNDDRWNLAEAIQQAVEDWFSNREQTDTIERLAENGDLIE